MDAWTVRHAATAALHAGAPAAGMAPVAGSRALLPLAGVAATKHAAAPPANFGVAQAAIDQLGAGPLQPSGKVAEALAAGRLLRTGDPDTVAAAERVLREGTIDRTSQVRVGGGMNGDRYRMRLADPANPDAHSTWAVERPAEAQAAQEELGWKLARDLGIDHLVPAVGRRADGSAYVAFREGTTLADAGVHDIRTLDQALTSSYLDDPALQLSPVEAAQAARIDRQLLQLLDYLLANNDRHLSNGLVDARRGGGITFLDFGAAGRGNTVRGAEQLRPSLRAFQASQATGGHVDLDPAVVAHARGRLTTDRVHQIHREVFEAADIRQPAAGTIGAQYFGDLRGADFRIDMSRRLEHAVETGGYDHVAYDVADDLKPRRTNGNPVGMAAVFAEFRGVDAPGMGFGL